MQSLVPVKQKVSARRQVPAGFSAPAMCGAAPLGVRVQTALPLPPQDAYGLHSTFYGSTRFAVPELHRKKEGHRVLPFLCVLSAAA